MKDICPYCGSECIGAIEFKELGWVMECRKCPNEWFEEGVVKSMKG